MDKYEKEIRNILVNFLDDIDLIDYDKTMLGVHVNVYARTAECLDKYSSRLRDYAELYYYEEAARRSLTPDQV